MQGGFPKSWGFELKKKKKIKKPYSAVQQSKIITSRYARVASTDYSIRAKKMNRFVPRLSSMSLQSHDVVSMNADHSGTMAPQPSEEQSPNVTPLPNYSSVASSSPTLHSNIPVAKLSLKEESQNSTFESSISSPTPNNSGLSLYEMMKLFQS